MAFGGIQIPVAFQLSGMQNVIRARNAVKSFGATSWGSFNQANRGASALNKSLGGIHATLGQLATGAGLAFLGKKLVDSTAELQTNIIVFETMMKDGKKAQETIKKLRLESLELGVDSAEMIKSARGLYGSLLQISKNGKAGVQPDDIVRVTKFAAVLSMLDTENRGVSFAAFSLKEMLQGTGSADFKSLTDRLEVNLPKETRKAITKAVQSRDMKKAISLFEQGLKGVGIDPKELIESLTSRGLQTNINRTMGMLAMSAQDVLMPTIDKLGMRMAVLNAKFKHALMPGSDTMKSLAQKGIFLRDKVFIPLFDSLVNFGGKMIEIGNAGGFETMKNALNGVFILLQGAGEAIGYFADGFFGIKSNLGESGDNAKTFLKLMIQIRGRIREAGERIKVWGEEFRKVFDALGGISGLLTIIVGMKFVSLGIALVSALAAPVLMSREIARNLAGLGAGVGGRGGGFGGGPSGGVGKAPNRTIQDKRVFNNEQRRILEQNLSKRDRLLSTPFGDELRAAGVKLPGDRMKPMPLGIPDYDRQRDARGRFTKDIKYQTDRYIRPNTPLKMPEIKSSGFGGALSGTFGRAQDIGTSIMNKIRSFSLGVFGKIFDPKNLGKVSIISGILTIVDQFTGEATSWWGKIGQWVSKWAGLLAGIATIIGGILFLFGVGGPIAATFATIATVGGLIAGVGAAASLAAKAWEHVKGIFESGAADLQKLGPASVSNGVISVPGSGGGPHPRRPSFLPPPGQARPLQGGAFGATTISAGRLIVGEKGREEVEVPAGAKIKPLDRQDQKIAMITHNINLTINGDISKEKAGIIGNNIGMELAKNLTSIDGNAFA